MSAAVEPVHGFGWRLGYTIAGFVPFAAVSAVQLVTKFTNDLPLDHATKAAEMPALALGAALSLIGAKRRPRLVCSSASRPGCCSPGSATSCSTPTSGLDSASSARAPGLHRDVRDRLPRTAAVLVGAARHPWFAPLLLLLAPGLGGTLPLVAVYGLVLGVMAAMATRGGLLTALGGLLFVASDSLLAFRMFTPLFAGDLPEFLVMLAYLAAQTLIVTGVLQTGDPLRPIRPGV